MYETLISLKLPENASGSKVKQVIERMFENPTLNRHIESIRQYAELQERGILNELGKFLQESGASRKLLNKIKGLDAFATK